MLTRRPETVRILTLGGECCSSSLATCGVEVKNFFLSFANGPPGDSEGEVEDDPSDGEVGGEFGMLWLLVASRRKSSGLVVLGVAMSSRTPLGEVGLESLMWTPETPRLDELVLGGVCIPREMMASRSFVVPLFFWRTMAICDCASFVFVMTSPRVSSIRPSLESCGDLGAGKLECLSIGDMVVDRLFNLS